MTTLAHRGTLRRAGNGGVAARRAVVRWALAHVPPRVAPAAPGADAPHRRGRGRGRQHHDRPQHGPGGRRRVRLGQHRAELRRLRSAQARRPGSPPPGARSGRSRSSAIARSPSPAASRPSTSARRTRTAPTAARCSRSAGAATPTDPARSPSPTASPTLLRLDIGSTLALDGRRRTVVGIVENPRKLSDEFALVSPSSAGRRGATSPSWSTRATQSRRRPSVGAGATRPPAFAGSEKRGNDHPDGEAAGHVLGGHRLPAPGLAGRRRRLRGRRAAAAAAARHARRRRRHPEAPATRAAGQRRPRRRDRRARRDDRGSRRSGSSFAPTLESAVDHRVDRLSVPWGLIATTVLLAVLGATAAAWWPGRTVARLPVMLALSGRPPKPRPARHAAIAAAALIAVGVGCLALVGPRHGRRSSSPGSWRRSSAACSSARWRSASSPAWPGASRSRRGWRCETSSATRPVPGAALAAVTLALGIAATVVVVASAERRRQAAEPPNLSDRQIRVYLGPPEAREPPPVDAAAQLERLAASVRQLAANSTSDGDPAAQGRATGRASRGHRRHPGLPHARAREAHSTAPRGGRPTAAKRSSTSPRRRCSGTSGSTPPRSLRARTSSPTAASRPTSSSSRA